MNKILLTGFEPFGGEGVNPSWLAAQALQCERVEGTGVLALCLPCVFCTALTQLQAALSQHRPTLVLALGQTAGTYLCNHVFYGLMHALRRRRGVRAGFMHLPLLPEQAKDRQPGLALAEQVRGVRLALATALTTAVDLRASSGTEA